MSGLGTSGRLAGKVAWITGAGGGLGRATAMAMAAEGARLCLTDIDAHALGVTLALLAQQHPLAEAIAVTGDVTLTATHAACVAQSLAAFGRVDILCNVAGVLGASPLAAVTEALFQQVMAVNCQAQLLAAQQVAPVMRRQGGGSIVNVASVGALVALPMMSLYCASKAAVLGLTRALAMELAPHIRCNAVCPGGIDTPMAQGLLAQVPADQRPMLLEQLTGRQLIQRFARPDEIASTLVFLASDASTFVTGAVLAADGGHAAT